MTRKLRLLAAFGLLEVVMAVAIVSTALLALQATVSGGIRSAGNSINRRAAREVARAKLEEILSGEVAADTAGGEIEDRPGFSYEARVEESMIGMPEAQSESIKIVIVELRYPLTASRPSGGSLEGGEADVDPEDETDTIVLASVMSKDQ